MATDTDTDAPFRLSSLIGEAGVGSNGELLVNSLLAHYPPELRAATLKQPNERLLAEHDRQELIDGASKIAGVEVLDVCIRGGDRSPADALVTYRYEDDRGDILAGAFPYTDLGKSSSKGHISQAESLAASPAARDHDAAQAKARAAAGESRAAQGSGDPIADFEEMKAADVVAYVEAHPERAAVVEALESSTRPGDERATVLKAVEKAKAASGGENGGGNGQGSEDPPPPAA